MKVLGYIDDVITLIYNWQVSIGMWNALIIPIEIFIIIYFILKFRTIIM